jgi:hypothetical protein
MDEVGGKIYGRPPEGADISILRSPRSGVLYAMPPFSAFIPGTRRLRKRKHDIGSRFSLVLHCINLVLLERNEPFGENVLRSLRFYRPGRIGCGAEQCTVPVPGRTGGLTSMVCPLAIPGLFRRFFGLQVYIF